MKLPLCKWFGHEPDPKTIKTVDSTAIGYYWVSKCKRCGREMTAYTLPDRYYDYDRKS